MFKEITVIPIGNPLRGDDGAGPGVEAHLRNSSLPEGIVLENAGADPFRLLEYMLEDREILLVDAVRMGKPPGTVTLFDLDNAAAVANASFISLHGIDIPYIHNLARKMNARAKVRVIGIEPEKMDFSERLSPVVEEAVGRVVEWIIVGGKSNGWEDFDYR